MQTKSARLNHLVEDLFEVPKANSGTGTINLEPLSLNELLAQAVGEYEDKFKEKKLDNVVKYGMDSTRVYDCNEADGFGWISSKNISSYEMNFQVDELTERFKQGDKSRSGEGSGLGLAIVKSFMKLQNCSCEIAVDGDLFKVLIKVPLA